jgi:hypothetical protein
MVASEWDVERHMVSRLHTGEASFMIVIIPSVLNLMFVCINLVFVKFWDLDRIFVLETLDYVVSSPAQDFLLGQLVNFLNALFHVVIHDLMNAWAIE